MAGQEEPKTAIVKASELGRNCWITARFIEGRRCDRVMQCNYPEKKTCKAVDAEIRHLTERLVQSQKYTGEIIAQLIRERQSE